MADGMALEMGGCTLVAKPHPFDNDPVFAIVKAGRTLQQMLGEGASHSLEVRLGGAVVPRELWAKIKPKAGQYIHATLYPQGGKAKKWIAIIAMVVITILSYGATAGWFATAGGAFAYGSASAMALAVGISIVGNLLVTPMVGSALEILA
jgi:hypothetical protein